MKSSSALTVTAKFQNNLEHPMAFFEKPSFDAFKFLETVHTRFSLPDNASFSFHYIDDEGDKISITTPIEWDTMFTHTWWQDYTICVTAQSHGRVVLPEPVIKLESLPFTLQNLDFVTWIKPKDEWKRYYNLTLNQFGIPHINYKAIVSGSPSVPVPSDLYVIELEWKREPHNDHAGYCMFYRGCKPGYYWNCHLDPDTIVFTGWLELPGQPKIDFRGVSIPKLSQQDEVACHILQMEEGKSEPEKKSTQESFVLTKDDERVIALLQTHGDKLKQLYYMGFTDVALDLYLLESNEGDMEAVVEQLSDL